MSFNCQQMVKQDIDIICKISLLNNKYDSYFLINIYAHSVCNINIGGTTEIAKIQPPAGSFVNLFVLDMDTYSEKYGSQSIRINVTIPAWLKTFGEKQNLNFSKVLQDALLEKESIK